MTSHRLALLAPACLLALAAPLFADEALPKVPDGFKCEIVLQAPDIEAPTALCVAPNGDVYFGEDTMDMGGPPTKNLDRIWLLKGGDPHKKILFAENMWAVMGLELVGDKLYCVNAPHVTVFTLNADGTAKDKTDLFTDLGPPMAGVPSFNDHIPSGIRYGADGWLYVSIGDKGIPKMTRKEADEGSVYVTEGRERRTKDGQYISLEGGGVIRFRPDGSHLEVFCSGTRNHLDVPLDDHDRIFVRDNTDDGRGWWARLMYLPPGGFMGYPWAYTMRPQETLPIIHDFGGGAPCQRLRLRRRRPAGDLPRPHLPLRMGSGQGVGRQGRSGRRRLQVRRSDRLHGPGRREGLSAVLDPSDGRRPRLLRHRLGLQRLAAEQEGRPHLQGHVCQGRREAGACAVRIKTPSRT